MAKYCKNCGKKLEDDMNICPDCGKSQEEKGYKNDVDKRANKGYKLGLWSIVAWLIPLAGYIVTIIGINNSVKGLKSEEYHSKAKVGLILCIIFLIASIANHVYSTLDMLNSSKELIGTYTYEQRKIVLEDGTCDITNLIENSTDCTWVSDTLLESKIIISYKENNTNKTIELETDLDNKTITYENNIYTKEN